MKKYLTIVGCLLLFFVLLFLLVEQLNLPILTDPSYLMETKSISSAIASVVLLTVDIFLPVPSSLIMIANGALFGIVIGSLLSLVGNLSAAVIGFFIGRRGGSLLERLLSRSQRVQANRLLEKWGLLAIIVTRPIPLLAETTVIVAGTSEISWSKMALATFAGSLPASLLYALTGATAASFDNSLLMFGLVLLIAGGFWLVGNRLHHLLAKKQ